LTILTAIVRNGRLELPNPIELPDGTEVQLWLLSSEEIASHPAESSQMTPEEITRTLAAMDQVEPLDLTEEEQAAWEAERLARKEWEKTHFADHAEKLRRMWE
jgi:hypothetical protein